MESDPRIRNLLWTSVVLQFVLYFLGGLVPDMSETTGSFIFGSLAFWTAAAFLIIRRRRKLTQGDVWFLRYGLVIVSLTCWSIVPVVWQWRMSH